MGSGRRDGSGHLMGRARERERERERESTNHMHVRTTANTADALLDALV